LGKPTNLLQWYTKLLLEYIHTINLKCILCKTYYIFLPMNVKKSFSLKGSDYWSNFSLDVDTRNSGNRQKNI